MKHPFQINLRIPPIFCQHTHLIIKRNSLPQFHILHQVALPELKTLSCQKLLYLSYQQKNLHQILILTQKSILPVDIPQDFLIYSHLSYQQNNLTEFLLLNHMSTLPVEIPQCCHLYSHLKSHWRSISQLYHLHQVTLPVDITPHPHQNKHQRNPLKLFSPNKITQVFHHQYLLRTHKSGVWQ